MMNNILQINEHIYIDQNNLLGKGSTGNVYLGGSYRDPSLKFAVKAIDLSEVNNEVTQYLLSCEIVALSELAKLNIDSIVKLHDILFQQGFCYLVMELLQGGSLAEYIRQNPNGLNEKEVEALFRQLFQGYKAIKGLGIVHRDIKPDNIIFRYKSGPNRQGPSKKLCFIDFGYCTKQSVPNRPQVYYNVGSPKYMSPEAFKKNTYSDKSDMWALGIILFEMLHGRTIDKDMEMDEYMKFMENNQIPITRNINIFLRNLLCGLLDFNVSQRISCDSIDQILNGNHHNPLHVHDQSNIPKFPAFVPQLDIPTQNINRRNSPFYRSEIFTHRSDPCETPVNYHSHHHQQNQSFDPRRQQRNFSQQNDLHQYNHSPKKIIHLEHNSHKVSGIVAHVPFVGDKRQILQNFRHFQYSNFSKQVFNGPVCPVRRPLEKIEQEHDQEANRQNFMRVNKTAHTFKVETDVKRGFLKGMDQRQFQLEVGIHQNQQQINNPNVRFINSGNFPVNIGTPIKQHELVRSQIFQIKNDRGFNSGNNFFSSQINENLQGDIKVVTSDKTIKNRGLDRSEEELFGKNLNKSYSTNNVTQNVQIRTDNQPTLINSRFVSLPFYQNSGQKNPQLIETIPASQNNIKPIEILIQNKQIASNRAFLRNKMPNVYRSTIYPSDLTQNQQLNHRENLENSKDLRNLNPTLIEQVNLSNFKNHNSYFDQNLLTPQKQSNLQNTLNVTDVKHEHPFTTILNKNEKNHSFNLIQQKAPHSIQRDKTMINLLNHTPTPLAHLNQPLQFSQPMLQVNRQQQLMNLIQHQPIQFNGQNVQVNHSQQLVPMIPMSQIQGKHAFFNNSQQKIIHQNQVPQSHHQMINLQQPTRSLDSQFRKSTIINPNELGNQQPIQINQQRNFVQNQDLSFQQPRQALIMDKPFFSQVSQLQTPILINTINQNPEINRMIRPMYPFNNQQPIPVTQY